MWLQIAHGCSRQVKRLQAHHPLPPPVQLIGSELASSQHDLKSAALVSKAWASSVTQGLGTPSSPLELDMHPDPDRQAALSYGHTHFNMLLRGAPCKRPPALCMTSA